MSPFQSKSSWVAWFLILFTLGLSPVLAETCTYRVDPKSLQVQWTAYKTNQKVAVGGSFTEVTIEGDLSNGSFEGLLNQIDADIKIDTAHKINTGNPARDLTLFQSFFSHFLAKKVVKGKLRETKGDDRSGEISLVLNMNRKTLAVPMKYSRDDQDLLTIKGAIDVNDFALSGALAKLNKACFDLHKGTDGVSKTWPQVAIKLQAKIAKKCQ